MEADSSGFQNPEAVAVLGRMPKSREMLRQTWEGLSGRWWPLLGGVWAALICQSILGRIPTVGKPFSLLLAGPVAVGIRAFVLEMDRGEPHDWENLLEGFERLARNIAAFLLFAFILFVSLLPAIIFSIFMMATVFKGVDLLAWNENLALKLKLLPAVALLSIPSVFVMLSCSQLFFLLAEEPELGAAEALRKSRDMMRGHLLELMYLHGWQFLLALLSVFTAFIGLIWLVPFFYASWARFYAELKKMPVVAPD